jgi:hypothetical protein
MATKAAVKTLLATLQNEEAELYALMATVGVTLEADLKGAGGDTFSSSAAADNTAVQAVIDQLAVVDTAADALIAELG